MSGEPGDLARFREAIRDRIGLRLETTSDDELRGVLEGRLRASAESLDAYLARLGGRDSGAIERRALAERLTVGETYFHRNSDQLRAFVAELLGPGGRCARARTLRVLSAGCSSGEEAYTVAILLREHVPDAASWDVTLRGLDLNPRLVARARAGRYSSWALRNTPAEVRQRWFRTEGSELVLAPALRDAAAFECADLLDDHPWFAPGCYDAIFFRNVSIYLTEDAVRRVLARLAACLVPEGLLFLGDAETTRNLSDAFEPVLREGAFYYRLRGAPLAPSEPLDSSVARGERGVPDPEPAAAPPPAKEPEPGPTGGLPRARELLARERFAEALAVLDALPGEVRAEPGVRLLRAVTLANRGDLAEAEAVCDELLRADDLDPGAHYVKALCREQRGDHEGAVDHDRRAIFLDAEFAMPRLHLALLARRRGDEEGARRGMSVALEKLLREDAERIAVFGGGFDRAALVALCRAGRRAGREGGAP